MRLCAWIAQPIDDVEELSKRQSCVKYLLEHGELFQALDAHFSTFKKSENYFLSFWATDHFKSYVIPRKSSKFTVPYITPFLESVETSLEKCIPYLTAKTAFSHGVNIASCLTVGLSTVVLPLYGGIQLYSEIAECPLPADDGAYGYLGSISKYAIGRLGSC